jgi:3-oxoacyl-[acyl-carrier protein] reductase
MYHPVVGVTGASRGIGREIAKQFALIGCRVCVTARDAKALDSLVKEIVFRGGTAHPFPADIADVRKVSSAALRIRRTVGAVDILVNNAGITVFKSFLSTTQDEFQDILHTNLLGQVAAIRSVLPSMVRRRAGLIINILSTASVKTFQGSAAYTAAKAGMHGLSKVLREEVRKDNVRIINVMPGPTATEMWSRGDRRKYASRMMTAKDVAETVLALYTVPSRVVPEEVMLSPIRGDIA